jgi:hypothetical protein
LTRSSGRTILPPLALMALLLGLFSLPVHAVPQVNILVNPAFATGDLTGWIDASSTSLCPGMGLPPFAVVGPISTLSPPPAGFPYAVSTGGCEGLVEQTFAPVFPTQISFWAEVLGLGGCMDAWILYSDSTTSPNLEVCNIGLHGLTDLTPWAQYFLTPDPSKAVTGIEIGHIYTGVGGSDATDFQVLVPQQTNVPEFNPGASTLLVAAPALVLVMILRSRMLGANKSAPTTETS